MSSSTFLGVQILLSGSEMEWKSLVVLNSLQPHGLNSPWNSLGQNTGVGSLSLLQGIFSTQDQTQISHITGWFFTSWVTREAQEYWNGTGACWWIFRLLPYFIIMNNSKDISVSWHIFLNTHVHKKISSHGTVWVKECVYL